MTYFFIFGEKIGAPPKTEIRRVFRMAARKNRRVFLDGCEKKSPSFPGPYKRNSPSICKEKSASISVWLQKKIAELSGSIHGKFAEYFWMVARRIRRVFPANQRCSKKSSLARSRRTAICLPICTTWITGSHAAPGNFAQGQLNLGCRWYLGGISH